MKVEAGRWWFEGGAHGAAVDGVLRRAQERRAPLARDACGGKAPRPDTQTKEGQEGSPPLHPNTPPTHSPPQCAWEWGGVQDVHELDDRAPRPEEGEQVYGLLR